EGRADRPPVTPLRARRSVAERRSSGRQRPLRHHSQPYRGVPGPERVIANDGPGAYGSYSLLAAEQPPGPQDLGDRPSLPWTTAREVRGVAVEQLGDGAEPGVGEVRRERPQHRKSRLAVAGHALDRLRVCPEEPGPGRALVIGAVTGHPVAGVGAAVGAMVRIEGPQTVCREEHATDSFEGRSGGGAVQERERQRQGEHLVRPQAHVVAVRTIDDVGEMAEVGAPEPGAEAPRGSLGHRHAGAPRRGVAPVDEPWTDGAQRVVPERVDLDGLAHPRGDDPPVDEGVHPRQLDSWLAGRELPVAVV